MANKYVVLASIYEDLHELGKDEIKRYMQHFPNEQDYNIAQYGNMLIYYDDVRELFRSAGYKVERYTNSQLWELYKFYIRVAINKIINEMVRI